MRILVTGSAGLIGRALVTALREAGHDIRTFDRTAKTRGEDGEHIAGDVRDIFTIRKAVADMDTVIHLSAVTNDGRAPIEDIYSVNVQGTLNLLIAGGEAGIGRFINFSSINALGCVGGHLPVKHFPISDDYPPTPRTAYQLTKHLAEEACKAFSAMRDTTIISLRPGHVAREESYARWYRPNIDRAPERHKDELWAYVDLRDVVNAACLAVAVEGVRHDAFLLLAEDVISNIPTRELTEQYYPDTPWIQDKEAYFAGSPFRSPIDCTHAAEVLGWRPKYSWRE